MTAQLVTTIQRWIGLSTDTKPTSAPVGSTFWEYDTKLRYVTYDGGTNWVPKDYTLQNINVATTRDMPFLVEFWETESLLASVWETIVDGGGTQAFGTAGGYMYYDMDTDAVGDNDVILNSKYRFQVRPASFGDSNSMIQRFVLEFEVQAVTAVASHDNTNFFLGLSSAKSNDITQTDLIGFYLDTDVLKAKTDDGGTESTTGAITATITNWNKYKIVVEDTKVTFYFNETAQTPIITNLPDVAMYLIFGTRAEGAAAVGLNVGNVKAYYEEIL